MSVKIRLRRTGALSAACWRVVVADSRSPRDGRFIENLGVYDPRHDCEKLNVERMEYWLSKGAQPSDTVKAIFNRVKNGKKYRYFTCPQCKKRLRVPRGVGNITITCKGCGNKFDKKA